jgi:hypothetical protein
MFLRPSKSLMSLGHLHRGISIFLLAFVLFDMAFIDVFFPQLCGDGPASPSLITPVESTDKPTEKVAGVKSIGKVAAVLAPAGDHGSKPDQDSHQSRADEDCFCCCSHVIPSPHINLNALNYPPQLDDPAIFSLPLSPPHDAFHPPRLS